MNKLLSRWMKSNKSRTTHFLSLREAVLQGHTESLKKYYIKSGAYRNTPYDVWVSAQTDKVVNSWFVG